MLSFKEVIPFSSQKRKGKGIVAGPEPLHTLLPGIAVPGLWEFTGSPVTLPFKQLQAFIHSFLFEGFYKERTSPRALRY